MGAKIGERIEIAGLAFRIPVGVGPSAARPMLSKFSVEAVNKHFASAGMNVGLGAPRDGTCVGMPGLITEGTFGPQAPKDAPGGKVWTCAFMKGDYAYAAFYALPTSLAARDEDALRSIIDEAKLRPPNRQSYRSMPSG